MKVCVISSSVFACPPPGYSGLEMISWLQAKGMAEAGHETFLVAPEGSTCPGVTVIPSGPPGQWDERRCYETYWKHLIGMDVVTDHSWMKWSTVLKQEGVLKCPVLCVTHAPVNTMYQTLPPLEKPCFVCISNDQASHFEALFSREARVCRNGVDVDFYKATGVPRTDRFLFLARFSSIKGADIALEACYRAGVGLDLVGDTSITNEPDYFKQCVAMSQRSSPGWDHSRGKQFNVVGGVSRSETVDWFSRAFCMLHPNQRFREPLGLAPLEAMACGCPVVAWKYGAMRETVKEAESGWLVSSLDEMTTLINKLKKLDRIDMGEVRHSAREWVTNNFTVGHMVRRYEELCREAVETGGW